MFVLLAIIKDQINTVDFLACCFYLVHTIASVDVDMGDLKIRYGEGVARTGVQQFKTLFGPHAKETGLAQLTVDVNRIIDRFDPVFTCKDYPNAL